MHYQLLFVRVFMYLVSADATTGGGVYFAQIYNCVGNT